MHYHGGKFKLNILQKTKVVVLYSQLEITVMWWQNVGCGEGGGGWTKKHLFLMNVGT